MNYKPLLFGLIAIIIFVFGMFMLRSVLAETAEKIRLDNEKCETIAKSDYNFTNPICGYYKNQYCRCYPREGDILIEKENSYQIIKGIQNKEEIYFKIKERENETK